MDMSGMLWRVEDIAPVLWWPMGLMLVGPTGFQSREKVFLKGYRPQGTAKGNRNRRSVFL